MLDLGLALFLALVAAGIGKRLLNWIGELPDHPLDALALATPLGLGLLALACLCLGQAGWLNLVGMAVLLGVATELGLLAGCRLVRALATHAVQRHEKGSTTVVDRLMFGFLVLTLAATALAALAPVTDGDALCYHLQVPKVFLVRQAVFFDPDLHETVYPLVTELLYAIGLEFRGPVDAAVSSGCWDWSSPPGLRLWRVPAWVAEPGGPPRLRSWCRRSATAWRLPSTMCPWPPLEWRRSWPGSGASTVLRVPRPWWREHSRAWRSG